MSYIKTFLQLNESSNESIKNLFLKKDFKKVKSLIKNSNEYKFNSGTFPPEIVEKEYNIKGISRKWKMPFGFTEHELEALSNEFMEDENVTNIIFNNLLNLNSELKIFKNIPFKNSTSFNKGIVIGGSCSRMNIEDIKDFLYHHTMIEKTPDSKNKNYIFKRSDENSEKYSQLYSEIYNSGILIPYFPSIETLRIIKSQI